MAQLVIYEVARDWRGNGPYTVEYQGFNEDIWREWGAYETEARAMANTLLSVERIYKARVIYSTECSYTHAHTKHFCGKEGCRES